MEIMGKNLSPELGAYIRHIDDSKEAEASTKRGSRAVGGDRVRLSSKIKMYQDAMKRIDDLPEIREEKVQQIRSALETGSYRINSENIANRVVNESLLRQLI